MNNMIKEFNERKFNDMEIVHKRLSTGTPRFGAPINQVVLENGEIMNKCSSYLYYYMLIEMAIKNLKVYKDDEETLRDIRESIKEYYSQYIIIVDQIKEMS